MSEKRVASEDKTEQAEVKKKQKKCEGDAYITLTGDDIDHVFFVSVIRSNFRDFKNHINEDNDVFEDKPIIYTHRLNNTAELAGYMLAIEDLNDYLTETDKLTYLQPNINVLCDSYDLIPPLIDVLVGLGALSVFNESYHPMTDKDSDDWRAHENEQTKFWREHTDMVSTAFFNNDISIDDVFEGDRGKRRAFVKDMIAYMQEFQTKPGFLTTLCTSGNCRRELGELIAEDYVDAKYSHPILDSEKDNLGLSKSYFKRLGLISGASSAESYILLVAISRLAVGNLRWDYRLTSSNTKLGLAQYQASLLTYDSDNVFNCKGKLAIQKAVVFNVVYLVKMLPCANCDCDEAHFLSTTLNRPVDSRSLIGYKYAVCYDCYDQIVYTN